MSMARGIGQTFGESTAKISASLARSSRSSWTHRRSANALTWLRARLRWFQLCGSWIGVTCCFRGSMKLGMKQIWMHHGSHSHRNIYWYLLIIHGDSMGFKWSQVAKSASRTSCLVPRQIRDLAIDFCSCRLHAVPRCAKLRMTRDVPSRRWPGMQLAWRLWRNWRIESDRSYNMLQ